MRDGTFFYEASSFVSSLRLMKSAFQLPPGPDTQTPKALSHPIHKVEQRVFNTPSTTTPTIHPQPAQRQICTPAMTHGLRCRHARTHILYMRVLGLLAGLTLWADVYSIFIIKAADLFIFTVSKQQASIIQSFFFLSLACLFFFSPTCLEVTH